MPARQTGPLCRDATVVISYRTFRNGDPPGLVRVWNDAFTGRGTVPLRNATLLEYFVLAKSYFDPAALQVALDGKELVGWALSGFAPGTARLTLDSTTGVLCVLGVLPSYRRQGIGSELLRRSEGYLRQAGARTLYAGALPPANPYGFGLYGGSQSPGFLESNDTLDPFLKKRGYAVSDSVLVMQRHLDRPFNIIDGRFPALRKRFDCKALPRLPAGTWYEESVRGPLELVSFSVEDKNNGHSVGGASIWEMEPFSLRWNESAVGILGVSVEENVRRQGVARLLLGNVLRFLLDQYFTLVESQVPPGNAAAVGLFRGLGFQQVDVGHRYRRS